MADEKINDSACSQNKVENAREALDRCKNLINSCDTSKDGNACHASEEKLNAVVKECKAILNNCSC